MGSNSLLYVAAAYGAIWVVLFIYLISIHRRVAAIRYRLRTARRRSEPEGEHIPVKAERQRATP